MIFIHKIEIRLQPEYLNDCVIGNLMKIMNTRGKDNLSLYSVIGTNSIFHKDIVPYNKRDEI